MGKLFEAMPGAQDLANLGAETEAANSGVLGTIGGLVNRVGGGGLMELAGELTGVGVSMSQMQSLGREFFAYGREKVGEDTMGSIVGAVPGLQQFV
jgi:hypothetical protein